MTTDEAWDISANIFLGNEKDIRVGKGVVPWSGNFGHYLGEGWVLPGGMRTNDKEFAKKVAGRIDAMFRGEVIA